MKIRWEWNGTYWFMTPYNAQMKWMWQLWDWVNAKKERPPKHED